jgi:hypothetical protein
VMDLSTLSTEDLLALQAGQLARVSTAGLQAMQRARQPELRANPTDDMGTVERLAAATGRGMVSAARGVGNLLGLVSDADMAEAKRLDAALLNTTAGKVGNVIGLGAAALPTAFIPGANSMMGATLIGAGVGGATTEGDALERLQGAAFGAAGGAAGKKVGEWAGSGARWLANKATDRFTTAEAASAGRMGAAQAAADAGFVVPPADLRPGAFTEALSGLSGKIKTAQVASARNQVQTNALARRALGLADDAPITADALAAVRADAGKAYDAVRGAGTITADQRYGDALDALGAANRNVMPEFPGVARSDVPGFVSGLKKDSFDASTAVDAIRLLRARADQAFRGGDSEMGRAAKGAAKEIEALIERNLDAASMAQTAISQSMGRLRPEGRAPGVLLADFRDARQLMAQTYTVEKALNSVTGDISAPVLARELAKGKPLSGELRDIAEAATSFPKAM